MLRFTGFERLKEDYESCLDFGEVYIAIRDEQCPIEDDYYLQDGYLFQANKLCIPQTSMRDFLIWEIHPDGLSGHFGHDKTIEEVEERHCQVDWSMSNMPNGQAHKAKHWPLHSPPCVGLPLARCQHELCAWVSTYLKETQFHLCGSRPLYQDGPLHSVHQDYSCF